MAAAFGARRGAAGADRESGHGVRRARTPGAAPPPGGVRGVVRVAFRRRTGRPGYRGHGCPSGADRMTLNGTVSLEPVVQEPTPSWVPSQGREGIAQGQIARGGQWHEAGLAEQLGVSRGPWREGLQRLTQEGLLISHRNRGLFLIGWTPENIRDMYLAREGAE